MRAKEFISELVSRANKLDHFKNRIALAAKLCEKLGDQPLVYRAFSHNNAMTLLAKIDNSDIENPQARKGGVGAKNQMAILRQLEIQYPVFCRMTPPSSARGFHGLESIFIPIGDVTPYWSPRIRDLGGIDYVRDSGEYHQSHVPVPGMPGVTRGNPGELDQTERWVKTYQHAWPNATTDHELIFDCASYYLLDMEVFFTKFAGKELKGMIDTKSRSSWKPINPEAFNKLKTYSNVAWYLNNTAMSYLNWWETKDLEKPVDANRNTQTLEERKKKRRVRRAAYGPGLYGGYGYFSNYGNSDSGDSLGDAGGGDGGESINHENFADGRSPGRNSQLNTLHDPQRMASAVAYLTDYYDSKEEAYQIIDAYTASVDKLITQGGAVYRAVWVAPGQKPKLKQPGLHWTLTPQSAEEYLQSEAGEYAAMDMDLDDQPHAYILSATVGPNNITNHGVNFAQQHHEQEVRIVDPKQAQIKVVKQVGMTENFADGKNPQDKGDSKRHGVPTKASVSTLRKVAKQGGRKGQLAHWMANMKSGKKK